jgi:hypothetical protein
MSTVKNCCSVITQDSFPIKPYGLSRLAALLVPVRFSYWVLLNKSTYK